MPKCTSYFICAWDSLQDDNTAEQAKQLLDDQKFDQRSGWWSVLLIFGGVVFFAAALYFVYAMIR